MTYVIPKVKINTWTGLIYVSSKVEERTICLIHYKSELNKRILDHVCKNSHIKDKTTGTFILFV